MINQVLQEILLLVLMPSFSFPILFMVSIMIKVFELVIRLNCRTKELIKVSIVMASISN